MTLLGRLALAIGSTLFALAILEAGIRFTDAFAEERAATETDEPSQPADPAERHPRGLAIASLLGHHPKTPLGFPIRASSCAGLVR